jgi:hypothetical protein
MSGMEEKTFCPLGAKCVDARDGVIHRCAWHIMVRGTDPNTGKEVDHWACSMAWMPTLLIENSQQQRQTGAAVESFRNEMVKANATSQKLLLASAQINGQNILTIDR